MSGFVRVKYVYTLRCPDSKDVKYVGTSYDPFNRYKLHLIYFSKSKKSMWIDGLLREGKMPLIQIERICFENHLFWEKSYIDHYKSNGSFLLNEREISNICTNETQTIDENTRFHYGDTHKLYKLGLYSSDHFLSKRRYVHLN